MSCLCSYEKAVGGDISWPLSPATVCGFAAWALSDKDLKPSTVRSYISSIAAVHELRGLNSAPCSDPLVKRVLKGAENLLFYK